jgi:hypothetical protein
MLEIVLHELLLLLRLDRVGTNLAHVIDRLLRRRVLLGDKPAREERARPTDPAAAMDSNAYWSEQARDEEKKKEEKKEREKKEVKKSDHTFASCVCFPRFQNEMINLLHSRHAKVLDG